MMEILSVSPNSGSLGGHEITITGTGFDADDLSVSFGGNDCAISSVTDDGSIQTIKCRLAPSNTAGTHDLKITSCDGTEIDCTDPSC